jgi:hypothetical protein
MPEAVQDLNAVSIFSILSDEEKEHLWAKGETLKYRLGQVVYTAGSSGDGFYIVVEGRRRSPLLQRIWHPACSQGCWAMPLLLPVRGD